MAGAVVSEAGAGGGEAVGAAAALDNGDGVEVAACVGVEPVSDAGDAESRFVAVAVVAVAGTAADTAGSSPAEVQPAIMTVAVSVVASSLRGRRTMAFPMPGMVVRHGGGIGLPPQRDGDFLSDGIGQHQCTVAPPGESFGGAICGHPGAGTQQPGVHLLHDAGHPCTDGQPFRRQRVDVGWVPDSRGGAQLSSSSSASVGSSNHGIILRTDLPTASIWWSRPALR